MPLTGLEPLDSSWQPARAFVINDRRLQANRVDHRPLAGCSLHNLGSGQQVAAGARRRGGAARIRSAAGFSCSVLPYHLVTSCSNCLGGDCGRFLRPDWLILGLYDAEWTQRTPLTTQMPHH